MMLPLTKTLDPADFDQLTEELVIVDRYFTSAREQHPQRRWEYAMALRAMDVWATTQAKRTYRAVDVGGGGSPFWKMADVAGRSTIVVDPTENYTLDAYLADLPRLSPIVTCLSVLEHVEDLDQFLYHLSCLVAPGGLLFLTMDCCGDATHIDQPDRHHFHWMRKQIFTLSHWEYLSLCIKPYGLELLGEADWSYHGNHVYDYTFCSLALVKRS